MSKQNEILNKLDLLISEVELLNKKQKSIPSPNNFVSISEASRMMQLSGYYLKKLIENGEIKTTKINGKDKIYKEDLYNKSLKQIN